MFGVVLLLVAPFVRAAEPSETAPKPAQPGDFGLRIEPGLAFPLTQPQSQRFVLGGSQTIKAAWNLTRWLDLGPSVTFLALPSAATGTDPGTAWTFGASLRLKRPHDYADDDLVLGLSPWLDLDALYVRTGPLNRPGFDLGAGASLPLGRARIFWLGPFIRYTHIFQIDRAGYDNRPAELLTLGLSLEVGSGVQREREVVAVAPAEIRTVNTETISCPDRDQDGVPDNVDHCPDVAGPMDNWGCPAYKKVVVHRDKLELKEKIQFAWNQALLQDVSFPLLDEVVQALQDNKSFRVQVEGHTSSEGVDEHNQTLSEQRAEAVLDYLAAHGIDKSRLTSKGFASSVPADTNATQVGRETNRRVEFVVYFIILNDGSK